MITIENESGSNMTHRERLLDFLSSSIGIIVIALAIGAFIFVSFGFRLLDPVYKQVSLPEFIAACGAIGVIVALIILRKGPGLK